MNIITGKENADKLREKYMVLELETLPKNGELVTAYCVIDAESMPLQDLMNIEQYLDLHENMIRVMNTDPIDKNFITESISHLKGKFGGTLDSFYEHIEKKL